MTNPQPGDGGSTEGFIAGTRDDQGFHAPILGADRLPDDVLAQVRAQIEAAGIDTTGVPLR